MRYSRKNSRGLALVELLIAAAIGAMLFLALTGVTDTALTSLKSTQESASLTRDLHFVSMTLINAIQTTRKVLIPRVNDPSTPLIDESVRNPGVLAFTVDPLLDRDANGIADADSDGDGKIDEDPGGDVNYDLAPGLFDIDDDGDGLTDEQHLLSLGGPENEDDDEDGVANEDGWDGTDDDSDGTFDEDPKKDMSGDGEAGLVGIDDDGDGAVDEGDKNDDDEDGLVNEDWLDTSVFYVQGTDLYLREPVPWDINQDGSVDGRDVIVTTLANGVDEFIVRRLPLSGRSELIEVELTLSQNGDSLQTSFRTRLGARR